MRFRQVKPIKEPDGKLLDNVRASGYLVSLVWEYQAKPRKLKRRWLCYTSAVSSDLLGMRRV